ncbi:MAG: gliding motility-associated C-terminal domain-containing protein [Bacteroidales bacterium]|nr:gliding motility-associated C-terminal domain-containing protein [Bacteroidales bacterium]
MKKSLILGFCLMFYTFFVFSQTDCNNATHLTFGDYSTCGHLTLESINLGNASVSSTTPSPSCGSFNSSTKDLWYSITVPSGVNTLAFHMFNSSLMPMPFIGGTSKPGMAVYRGTDCNNLVLLDCFSESGGFMQHGEIRFEPISGLIPGETLWIRAWDQDNQSQNIFIAASVLLNFPEDDCNTPAALGSGGCNILSTGGDITAPEQCGWSTTDNSVFYHFTVYPEDAQPYTITAENGECWSNSSGMDNPEIQFAVYSWNGVNCSGIGGSGSTYWGCANGTGVVTYSNTLPAGDYVLAFDGYSMMSGNSLCVFGMDAPFITPDLIVNLNTTDAICGFDGSAFISVVSSCTGNPTINWSNSATGFNSGALQAGNYSVTVSDGVECPPQIINFTIEDSGSIEVEAVTSGDPCNGVFAATANITGANPSQCTYAWNTIPPQNTQTATNLSEGTYTVTVTYGTCTATDQVNISVYEDIEIHNLNAECNSTNTEYTVSFNVTTTSGNPTNFYANWGTGNQEFTNTFSHNFPSSSTYSITVSDMNNCYQHVLTDFVDCSVLNVNLTTTNAICGMGGSATVNVISSCSNNPTVTWSNGSSGLIAQNLEMGEYSVTITDNAPCSDTTITFIISDNGSISVEAEVSGDACEDFLSATANVTGANPVQCTYSWNTSPPQNTQTATNLTTGLYTVTVTYGTCTATDQVNVSLHEHIQIINQTTNCDAGDTYYELSFDVTTTSGVPANFLANWGSGYQEFYGSFSHNFLSQTNYSLTVTDMHNCDQFVINGFLDCSCITFAGTLNTMQAIHLCDYECVPNSILWHNGDEVLDNGDILEYILYTGTNPIHVVGQKDNPNFCPSDINGGVNFETTYYISAVAGNYHSGSINPNEVCFSQSAGTPVVWHKTPIAHINGNVLETCGNSIHLSASPVESGQTGYWSSSVYFVPIGGGGISSPELDVIVNSYGDYWFYWNVSNYQCVGKDSILVHFRQTPNAYAGEDFTVCGNSTNLNAILNLDNSIGQWSAQGATINQSHNPNTLVSVNSYGTYTFLWTESNGACFSQDSIKVTFLQEPNPNISLNIDTVCGNHYTLNVLNSQHNGQWTAFNTDGEQIFPTFLNGTDQYSTTAQVSLPAFSDIYHYTVLFKWTEVNEYFGVQCFGSDSIQVTFAREPSASIGVDNHAQVCGYSYTFNADTLGSEWANGTWIAPNIIAQFDDITSPNAFVTIDSLGSFGDSAHVQVSFLWTMNNYGCVAIDTMFVTFYNAPIANAGVKKDSICGFEYNLKAYYSIAETESYYPTGRWTLLDGSTNLGINIADINNPETNVTVPTQGTYRFIWRETNTLMPSCSSQDTVEITFIEIPVIDAGDDFHVCGQEANLNAVSAGFEGSWMPMPGINFENPNNPHTTVSSQTYGARTFFWQEANGMCTAIDDVTITFWKRPTPEILTATDDSTQCGLCFKRLQAGNPGAGIRGSWRDLDEPNAIFTQANVMNPDTVCVTQYGVHRFVWVEENGPESQPDGFCSDTAGPINVRFIRIPEANAGNDTLFCGKSGYLNAIPSYGTGTWTTPSTNNVTFESLTDPNTYIETNVLNTSVDNQSYLLVWTEDNMGNCTDKDTIYITFAPIPSGQFEIKPPKCFGEYATLIAKEDTLATYNWQFEGLHTDSISGLTPQNGDYRHSVKWHNEDTVHFVTLVARNYWGCESPAHKDTIYEPPIPEYSFAVYPDTCLLKRGAVLFSQDSIANSFEWLDIEGTPITPTHIYDQEHYNIPAGSYRVASTYTTFNHNHYTFYMENFGTAYCYDTLTIDIKPAGLIEAEFEVSIDIDIHTLVAPEAEVWYVNLTDYDDIRTRCTWYFGDGSSSTGCDVQMQHVYTDAGCFEPYLVVMSRDIPECRDTARLDFCIPVDAASKLEVPNIFTPNGDGHNDFFQVKAQTLKEFKGIIINRWGKTVYEWTNWEDMEAGWDGKLSGGSLASPGVYFYIIKAVGIDKVEYELYGPLHLMREK